MSLSIHVAEDKKRRDQNAGLPDTERRDPHKPGESPALQGCSDPFRQAREHYVIERVEVEILRASSSDALRMTDLFLGARRSYVGAPSAALRTSSAPTPKGKILRAEALSYRGGCDVRGERKEAKSKTHKDSTSAKKARMGHSDSCSRDKAGRRQGFCTRVHRYAQGFDQNLIDGANGNHYLARQIEPGSFRTLRINLEGAISLTADAPRD